MTEVPVNFTQTVDFPAASIEKILKQYMIDNYGDSWKDASLIFKVTNVCVGPDDYEYRLTGAKLSVI